MKNSKTRISLLAVFTLLLFSVLLSAQSQQQKPCSSPEAAQFDFWVGNWNLTWNDTVTGTNEITKELNGCVIHENFYSPSTNYKGTSYSVYSPAQKMWQQTWVDNQGGYLDFTGGMEDGKMVLKRSFVGPKGAFVTQRMVYYNITKDSLDWSWESSLDSGQTWKQNWQIHYKRAED